ncbi:MAG: T9SS type A sorting domain-containing protein, partial [Flavitalea sp.]
NNIGVRLSFTPTSIVFDPNSQILATATSMTVNSALPIRRIILAGKSSSSKNILSIDASFTGVIQKLILERSINGQDFDALKSIEKPEVKESYVVNMEDANPTFSDLYYRIKLIMTDGEIGYSNIIKLSNQDVSGDIAIYPNAATDNFNVAVKSNSEKVQIKIYTQDGKLKEIRNAIGKNILVKFNCVSWTKGFYLVEIHDGSTIQRRKLLIH